MEPPAKKIKTSPYFVSELVHVVSACEERLPFVFLGDEVSPTYCINSIYRGSFHMKCIKRALASLINLI